MIIKKLSKKTMNIFLAISLLVLSIGIIPTMKVSADDSVNATKIVLNNSSNTVSIDNTNTNTVNFMFGDELAGTLKIKVGGNYILPEVKNGKIEFNLDKYTGTSYYAVLEAQSEDGYEFSNQNAVDGGQIRMEGTYNLEINKNDMFLLDFSYEVPCTENCGGELIRKFPLVAYFGDTSVDMDYDMIVIPSTWTGGNVNFKAKTCTVDNVVSPDSDECTGTKGLMDVDIEGIVNRDQIHQTVDGVADRSHIIVKSGFFDYGKVSVHLMNGAVNQGVSLVTDEMIDMTAEATIPISFGMGSADVSKSIITKESTNDLMIFFGNNSTTLRVGGKRARGITEVEGATAVINDDGSASLNLPDYRVATSLDLTVTVKLDDNTKITRNIRVVRTAVTLKYNAHDKKVFAGYAANKGYLYNNQKHDAGNFDAYLQVILYKDDTVVGYKQIKINDSFVDGLNDNQSDGIEATDTSNATTVYEEDNTGVNKVSVFLTNGKIKSTTVPSLKYGVGAGLVYTWEDVK